MCLSVNEGLIIKTNNKTFAGPGNPRLEAAWKAAVDQLEEQELIDPLSFERQVFKVTHGGFKLADRLRQESVPECKLIRPTVVSREPQQNSVANLPGFGQ